MEDWPKLEMILPASKVRPRSENFCSAIGDTFTAAPLPQTVMSDQRAPEQQLIFQLRIG
jgi:hypothetical protein